MEAPLTPKPRSVARCPQGDDRVLRRDGDAAAVPTFPAIAGLPRGRRPGDFTAAVFRCTPHTRCGAWRNAARGVSRWAFARCNDVTGRCWSGTRTRDSRCLRPMLYPTELSSGGRTGFEPATVGIKCRYSCL